MFNGHQLRSGSSEIVVTDADKPLPSSVLLEVMRRRQGVPEQLSNCASASLTEDIRYADFTKGYPTYSTLVFLAFSMVECCCHHIQSVIVPHQLRSLLFPLHFIILLRHFHYLIILLSAENLLLLDVT